MHVNFINNCYAVSDVGKRVGGSFSVILWFESTVTEKSILEVYREKYILNLSKFQNLKVFLQFIGRRSTGHKRFFFFLIYLNWHCLVYKSIYLGNYKLLFIHGRSLLLCVIPPEINLTIVLFSCFRIKILEMFSTHNLQSVFARLIEPPHADSLRASKIRLRDLGALTPDETLTPLGYHLASLPVDVRIGKLMLFGSIFRCLDPALTIAASLAFKSPFVSKQHSSQLESISV